VLQNSSRLYACLHMRIFQRSTLYFSRSFKQCDSFCEKFFASFHFAGFLLVDTVIVIHTCCDVYAGDVTHYDMDDSLQVLVFVCIRLNLKDVPLLVEVCIDTIEDRGLTNEGIYRVPGNAGVVYELQKQLDRVCISVICFDVTKFLVAK